MTTPAASGGGPARTGIVGWIRGLLRNRRAARERRAEAIRRSRQPALALPWAGPQTIAPQPAAPVVDLRERVRRQIIDLGSAAADHANRADARTMSASAAGEEAAETFRAADAQEALLDSAAAERARRLRVRGDAKLATAERHTMIAAACTAAAQQATDAINACRVLLTELDALETSGRLPGPELAALAQTAGEKVDGYQAAAAATVPSKDVQHNALPSGRLPHLTVLCRDLNAALAEQNASFRFTPDLLHRTLRAETRRLLSPDGFVLTIGNDPRADVDELIQIEFKLDPGELHEVLDSPIGFDEAQVGQVGQAGFSVATTATRATGSTAGLSLRTAAAILPDPTMLAVSTVASPGLEFAVGRSHSVSSNAAEVGQTGAMEVLRGEILRYRSTQPRWSWRMRTSAAGPWSPPRIVGAGDRDDAATLDLGYSHSYTVGPPDETVSLEALGLSGERSTALPEHVASRVDGLNDLCDQAVSSLRRRLGSLDRVGHDQLRGLLADDAMTRLHESAGPGGIGRLITNGGRAVAYAQLETVAVPESAELLTDSSPDHKIELWRVGNSSASGSQTFARSRAVTGTVGFLGTALSDLGTTSADLGPGLRAGRSTSREDSMSTADTGSRWSTQRMAPTLGVKIRMRHKLTIHRLDRDESFTVDGEGDAFLRMLEKDAFRYGLPVPAKALVRGPDGDPQRGADGRLLLRGDPRQTEQKLHLPVWLGNGPGQLRGAGPAMIQDFEGADPALRRLLVHLADQDLIPPVDPDGRPLLRELAGKDPALVVSQLENFERVSRQIANHRLEAGYDQAAAQSGVLFELIRHRTGVPPEVHTYRITVGQHFEQAEPLGLTTTDMVANIDIGENVTVRSGRRSKALPWSARLGLSNKPDSGVTGSTPELGTSYGRTALGRFLGWATSSTAYRTSMSESSAPVAVFHVPHTITVTEVTAAGESEPLAVARGSARVCLDSEFCDRGEQPTVSIAGRVDPGLLQTATIQHIDARDPVGRLTAAVPELARGDSAAMHHVSGFLAARNLIARPELLTTEYRTGLIVSPAPSDPQAIARRGRAPRRSTLSITTRVENLRYVGSGQPVIADLAMTTGSTNSTAGVAFGSTIGISGGGGRAEADGSSVGGSLGVSRADTSSASGAESAGGGVERTVMRDGQHYQFWGDLILDAELRAGGSQARKVELDSGAIVLTLPERDALRSYGQRKLDLPLQKVSDAVERLLNGNLNLPRHTTTALIRRYRTEKAGVTEGLAATHTDERLAGKLRAVAGLRPAPNETLDAVMVNAEEITRQRVEVPLPRHYRTTLGAALVDRTSLQDLDGNDTDLLREVHAAIRQHAPNALEDPVLATALRGDLAGARWRGYLDEMLDPGGLVREYPVGTSGRPRNLRVRVRLAFDGPVTVDGGATDGQTDDAANLVQLWNLRDRSRSVTTATSYGGSIGAAGTDGLGTSAGLSTDLGASATATSSELNTRISEAFWRESVRVDRDYRVIVEVEQSLFPGGDPKPIVGGRPRTAKPTRRESTGRMTLFVPAPVIGSAPPEHSPEVIDHRPVTLPAPAHYLVEGTQPYPTGAEPVNTLFEAVYRRLGRPDLLMSTGVRMHKTTLESMLGASGRMAAFQQMAGPSGYDLVPLAVPGHGSRVVAVRVRAEVSGLELISDPDDSTVQLGENSRETRLSQLTTQSNRLLPTNQAVGGTSPSGDFTAGLSRGEQVAEKDTGTVGGRHELGSYEFGQVVTVKVSVDYHLDFERRTLDRNNQPRIDRADSLRHAATGEAYLTMFRHEYDEMRARMEAGQPPLAGWDPSNAKPKEVPTVGVNTVADEQHPYRPLVEALARARREGVTVRLAVRAQDGQAAEYVAAPDGTMTGRDDDGFAAAFATLHPRLALLAEGRLDLRELYRSSARPERFTGAVVEALQHQGFPASVLTETDSALGRPAEARAGSARPQRTAAAANTGLRIE